MIKCPKCKHQWNPTTTSPRLTCSHCNHTFKRPAPKTVILAADVDLKTVCDLCSGVYRQLNVCRIDGETAIVCSMCLQDLANEKVKQMVEFTESIKFLRDAGFDLLADALVQKHNEVLDVLNGRLHLDANTLRSLAKPLAQWAGLMETVEGMMRAEKQYFREHPDGPPKIPTKEQIEAEGAYYREHPEELAKDMGEPVPTPTPIIEQIMEQEQVTRPTAEMLLEYINEILKIWQGDAYLLPAEELFEDAIRMRPPQGYFTQNRIEEIKRLRRAIRVLQRMHASRPE